MRTPLLVLAALFALAGPTLANPTRPDVPTRFVLAAHDQLPLLVWKRVLEVRDGTGREVTRYLIFNLHHTYFSYSAKGGSRRIWPAGETPGALARAIRPGSVVSADFMQPDTLLANR